MARTIAQIQQSIIDAKNTDSTLSGLTSASSVALWLLWTYIVAVCQWTLENLFDAHKSEVSDIIAIQKPHTLQWYVTMAKLFQYGVALPDGSDTYSVPSTDPAIAIVEYAAAVELTNIVRIKAATLTAGVLGPLSVSQLNAFSAYMNLIKDAGVRLQLTSGSADTLQVAINIFYDPLVLSADGARLDGANATPVQSAINSFLADLPFNGLFVLNNLVATLQAIEGVVIGQVVAAQASYASLAYTAIDLEYTPDAGYMALDATYFAANVTYAAHSPI